MPDPNDPSSYDPNEDDWTVPPDSGVDADGNAVSRDPNAPDEDIPLNPYDAALIGPQQPVDADGLPISTPPAPASSEPMEDGREDEPPEEDPPEEDPPEDDPEEKKPPIQKRVVRKKPRLPGAKGPLEVDSIGDYLEDVDWTEIDSQARKQAEENYPEDKSDPEPEPPPETEPEPKPDSETTFGIFRQEPEPPPEPPPETPLEPPPDEDKGEKPSTVSGDMGEVESNSYYSPPSQESIVPVGPPATPEHLRKQREVDLSDSGSQGPSSFSQPGQNRTAKEDAVERATDAINTATGRIVDTLSALAQVMNNHSHRIAQIEDQLDMESERDVS